MKSIVTTLGAALTLSVGLTLSKAPVAAQQNPVGLAQPGTAKVQDVFSPLPLDAIHLNGGMLGTRFAASEKNRLLKVDENDLLDAFERRNAPHQDWQGEHVGKFLHAATQAWANTKDPSLKAKLDRVVARLLKTQEPDGYLGTYIPSHRWTSWDVWVHKYDLLGLLTYYQFTHDKAALQACRRVGDLLIRTFGTGPGQRDINKAGEHVGMAADSVLEPVMLLYRATGDARYRKFADYIVTNYDAPGGPAILASLEKYKSVRRVANGKAYEMVSNFNGLLERYRVTGEKPLLNAMLTGWNDIVQNRLYITGSASSGEVFQDDFHLPNGEGASICETCVTVTWEQMNLQLLRLTGASRFADEIERSVYNHLLGAQKPTGDMWAYYTPLEGHKPYGNSTNCCLSSGPRGIALLPSIAVMTSADNGLVVNLYNSMTATAKLTSGRVTLDVKTDFPLDGKITVKVTPEKDGQKFPLRLRIPKGASGYAVIFNGQKRETPLSQWKVGYVTFREAWKKGDTLTLNFNMLTSVVLGDHENEGKAAVFYGPLVLACDTALNPDLASTKQAVLPADNGSLTLTPAPEKAKAGEMVFKATGSGDAKPLYLTPYATAGQDGKSRFAVWMWRPGHIATGQSGSVLFGGEASWSRTGNQDGDITDDDFDTFRVTYNARKRDEDWFAVTLNKPETITRLVYAHGRTFHDGGWFDTSSGTDKPRLQVRLEPNGEWQTVATLDAYPATTATDSADLKNGQRFEVKITPTRVFGVRILGKPACGDNPAQSFASCAELQAFK